MGWNLGRHEVLRVAMLARGGGACLGQVEALVSTTSGEQLQVGRGLPVPGAVAIKEPRGLPGYSGLLLLGPDEGEHALGALAGVVGWVLDGSGWAW